MKKKKSGVIRHTIRTSTGCYRELNLTRKLAMAAYCTECMGYEDNPINCTSTCCPMYPWRAKTGVSK